jgi:hypothetical protein
MNEQEDGKRFHAQLIRAIEDAEAKLSTNPTRVQFTSFVNDDEFEEILSYNEVLNHIESHDYNKEVIWKFCQIVAHEGPLKPSSPSWKGSTYNVMIEWEMGEVTTEPLTITAADDPVTCAIYALENDVLDLPGWRQFNSIAKREKKMLSMVHQAKLRSFRTAPEYMYGHEVPRPYNHAVCLDQHNGSTKWQDAIRLEINHLHEYETFKDHGHKDSATLPQGYKKIWVHLVFAVNHDGCHKACCVADGHLTDIPFDSVYSGVISLRAVCRVVFLAELNGLVT